MAFLRAWVEPVSTADVDRYYERILEPDELRKRGQTAQALVTALELTALVPSVIAEATSLYGHFDLGSIPPIEVGCGAGGNPRGR